MAKFSIFAFIPVHRLLVDAPPEEPFDFCNGVHYSHRTHELDEKCYRGLTDRGISENEFENFQFASAILYYEEEFSFSPTGEFANELQERASARNDIIIKLTNVMYAAYLQPNGYSRYFPNDYTNYYRVYFSTSILNQPHNMPRLWSISGKQNVNTWPIELLQKADKIVNILTTNTIPRSLDIAIRLHHASASNEIRHFYSIRLQLAITTLEILYIGVDEHRQLWNDEIINRIREAVNKPELTTDDYFKKLQSARNNLAHRGGLAKHKDDPRLSHLVIPTDIILRESLKCGILNLPKPTQIDD